MSPQSTLYIAEPIYSEKLQRYDTEATFPPVKKIGVTTDHPERRERELLGTISPVKVSIVKAWTNIDARKVESMLHTMLDNSRLDGEYFWDGNEVLVDAVSDFIATYHSEAEELIISDDSDVKAATDAVQKKNSQRIYVEVVPELEKHSIQYKITKNGKGIRFGLGDYNLVLSSKTGGKYTFTIFSKIKTTENALSDFENSQECGAGSTEDSPRVARIPMSDLTTIMSSIARFAAKAA